MPTSRESSTTGRQPYLLASMMRAASRMSWPGAAVTTPWVMISAAVVNCIAAAMAIDGKA